MSDDSQWFRCSRCGLLVSFGAEPPIEFVRFTIRGEPEKWSAIEKSVPLCYACFGKFRAFMVAGFSP